MADNSFWDSFSSGFSDFNDGVSDFFNVGSTVSPDSNMNGDDVIKTKSALNAVGSYDVPNFGITEIPDTNMIDGLKNFQANNGLKVDGVMKPNGPTENALGQNLANQGVSTTDLLEKEKAPSIKQNVPKPPSAPQTSWSASSPIGDVTKPKTVSKNKIDPTTGLVDPLASAPKGKMPTKKQWEEVAKMQKQKVKTAIVPQGETVQQRIQSMMNDKRYGDKNDTRLRDHIQKQFKQAYPGTLQYDETGKMVQPKAVIHPNEVEPFDPDGELKLMETSNDQQETPDVQGRENQTTTTAQVPAEKEFNPDQEVTLNSSDEEKVAQSSSYEREEEKPRWINNPKRREESLTNDEDGRFHVRKNPEADGEERIHEISELGRNAVKKYDDMIGKAAEKYDVDPDLVRAVMWAENARGHKLGANALADAIGKSKTVMPMNINTKKWAGLIGAESSDMNDPKKNIEASAVLLKRIKARMDDPNDVAKIGTIWNGAGLTKTNDFGEFIGRVYREKPWRQ